MNDLPTDWTDTHGAGALPPVKPEEEHRLTPAERVRGAKAAARVFAESTAERDRFAF